MTGMKSLRWKALTAVFVLATLLVPAMSFLPLLYESSAVYAQDKPTCPDPLATYDEPSNKCTKPRPTNPRTGGPDACAAPFKARDLLTCEADPVVVPGNAPETGTGSIKCQENFTPNGEGKCVGQKVNGKCPTGSEEDPANGNQCIANPEDGAEDDDCPVPKNQEFRWLYCPVFTSLGLLTNTIDSFINEYLSTGNMIYGSKNENGYKQAWQTFRNFGIALVIIAGLVMLVSEAFGLEFIDAYTVRKVLPRLLIAVVGISLSWELCKFLVTFFDTLGRAAGSIIYTSFGVGEDGIALWALFTANMFAIGGAARHRRS